MPGAARWVGPRLPLRARAAAGFGITALLLGVALAALAYSVIRQQLVDERQDAVVRQSFTNARIVRTGLRATDADIPRLLSGLQLHSGGVVFLHRGDEWFANDIDSDRDEVPADIRSIAAGGKAVHQVVSINGRPDLVVGVPVAEAGAEYFQVVPLSDIERTLSRLVSSLALATALATALAMAVGIAISGAVLRPLGRMTGVARRIRAGDLDSRLSARGDPDLATLVAAFNEMLDELQSRIDREARFASDVAHEVRGPLTALAAAVEVVNRRRSELPERAVLAVDALERQVRTFNALVLDLLEISRFDAGAAQLEAEPIDVVALARATLDDAGCAEVEVRAACRPTVVADRRRLHQVLANLVQNAQHYAGGPAAVTVDDGAGEAVDDGAGEAVDDGAGEAVGDGTAIAVVRVGVEDGGPGVPEHERRAIFERFERGKAAAQPGAPRGSGLGLALVAQHVELHGGRVWVEDAEGGGARFVVELPQEPR